MDYNRPFCEEIHVKCVQDTEMKIIIMSARKGDRSRITLVLLSIAVIKVIVELTEKIGQSKRWGKRGFQIKIDLTIRMRIVAGEFVQKRILVDQVRRVLKCDRYGRRTLRCRERRKRASLREYLVPERERYESEPVEVHRPRSESRKQERSVLYRTRLREFARSVADIPRDIRSKNDS